MDVDERYRVSAALDTLAKQMYSSEEELLDCLQVVVNFGSRLPLKQYDIQISHRSGERENFQAHTPEHGSVGISTEEEKRKRWEVGGQKTRIGSYKLWRTSNSTLSFHHFWASDIITSAENENRPLTYGIQYSSDQKPTGFWYYDTQPWLRIGSSWIFRTKGVFLYGKGKKATMYGLQIVDDYAWYALGLALIVILSILVFW